MLPAKVKLPGMVEGERAVIDNVAGDRARSASIAAICRIQS